jgi:hypothetical protein
MAILETCMYILGVYPISLTQISFSLTSIDKMHDLRSKGENADRKEEMAAVRKAYPGMSTFETKLGWSEEVYSQDQKLESGFYVALDHRKAVTTHSVMSLPTWQPLRRSALQFT